MQESRKYTHENKHAARARTILAIVSSPSLSHRHVLVGEESREESRDHAKQILKIFDENEDGKVYPPILVVQLYINGRSKTESIHFCTIFPNCVIAGNI